MGSKEYLDGAIPYSEEVIREYVAKGWWLDLTYGDILNRSANAYPSKIAVIDERVRLTYADLQAKVDRLALAFLELGIKKYDRILLQLPNRHEFVIAYYAAQRIGAVPVLTVIRQEYQEISHFIRLAEPVAWVVPARDGSRELAPMIEKIRDEHATLKYLLTPADEDPFPNGALSLEQLIEGVTLSSYPADYLAQFRPDPNDVAMIVTTGGTSGLPKGVPRTHNSFLANVRYTSMDRTADSILGLATPIGHTMAHQGAVGASILLGATLVLITIPRAREILEAIHRWRITDIGLVPTQLEDILNTPDLERYDLTSLKSIRTAGAALRPETATRAREVLSKNGARFSGAAFGSSEGPCAGPPLSGATVPRGSVGVPHCPGDHWKVVDENEQELPKGTEGELVAKGPCVFTGYYRSEIENRVIFTRDGYYRTGDLGRIDPQGNIFITGRKKDIIQRGGEGIIPQQVEDLLHQLPEIAQAAVVAMPDIRLGEKPCAYVVLKPGASLGFEQMIRSLRERGAGVLLLPERLEITDALPTTRVGKIDKAALRKQIAEKIRKHEAIQISDTANKCN